MADTNIKITATNDTQKGINEAKKGFADLGGSVNGLGSTLKSLGAITAITALTAQAINFGKECFKSAIEAEAVGIKLKAALGGSEQAFARMNSFVSEFSKKTLVADDEIANIVGSLAALGRSEEDIKKIITASEALARVSGGSLSESWKQVNDTLNGATGKIGKLVPEIENLTASQLANGGALDLLNNKLGPVVDKMGDSTAQKVKNLSESFENLQESIGTRLADSFAPLLEGLADVFDWLDKIINKDKEIRDARKSGNVELAKLLEEQKKAQDAYNTAKPRYDSAVLHAKNQNTTVPKDVEVAFQKLRNDLRDITTKVEMAKGSYSPNSGSAPNSPAPNANNADSNTRLGVSTGKSYDVGQYPANDRLLPNFQYPAFEDTELPSYFDEFANAVEEFIPALEGLTKEEAALYDYYKSGEYVKNMEEANANAFTSKSYADPLGAGLFDVFKNLGSSLGGLDLSGLLGSLSSSLAPLFASFAPLVQMFTSANPVFSMLLEVVKGFVSVVGPAISQIIQPLFSALQYLGATLGQMLLPIIDSLAPVFAILGEILVQSITPIIQMLAPVIAVIAVILDTVLTPVLKVLAIAFEILSAPVKFVGDLFTWVGEVIRIFGENVKRWMKLDFTHNQSAGGFSSTAFSGLADRIANIWNKDYKTSMAGSFSDINTSNENYAYTPSAGNPANYQSSNITINYYQNGDIFGTDSDELVSIFRDSLDLLLERNL